MDDFDPVAMGALILYVAIWVYTAFMSECRAMYLYVRRWVRGKWYDWTMRKHRDNEGVCCCGDPMDRHGDPMHCGHSPVDAWHYYRDKYIEGEK